MIGLAVLSALYFSQARDLRRLREWAGRAPERAAETPPGPQAPVPGRVVAVPQRQTQVPPGPATGPNPATAAAAAPVVPAAGTAAPSKDGAGDTAGQNGDAAPAVSAGEGAKPAEADAAKAGAEPKEGEAGAQDKPASTAPQAGRRARPGLSRRGGRRICRSVRRGRCRVGRGPGRRSAHGEARRNSAHGHARRNAARRPAHGEARRNSTNGHARHNAARRHARHNAARRHAQADTAAPTRVGAPAAHGNAASGPRLPSSNVGAPAGPASQPPQRKRNPLYVVLAVAGVLILGAAAAVGVPAIVNHNKHDSGTKTSKAKTTTHKPKVAASPSKITVAVLNGTSIQGLAAQIGDRVEADGFRKGTVSNASVAGGQRANSVVMYAKGHDRDARLVARRLSIKNVQAVDTESQSIAGDASVVVVVGTDKTQ